MRAIFDHEALYRHIQSGRWTAALNGVRSLPGDTSVDTPAGRAVAVLLDSIVGVLENDPDRLTEEDLESWILLGRSGRLPVSGETEAGIVQTLITRYHDRPEKALAVARFRPDVPAAASVLAQFSAPKRVAAGAPDGHPVQTTALGPDPSALQSAGRPLLRSARERSFFEAAQLTWPSQLVVPNVALHAALDFDLIAGRLTAAERGYFFRGLVDVVTFDPMTDYRPVHFFEVDSHLHEDARQADRDASKDRILSLAGYTLIRIRPPDNGTQTIGTSAYHELLKHLDLDQGGTGEL